jgi:dienelactone hydrolase
VNADALRAQWLEALGSPEPRAFDAGFAPVKRFACDDYVGTLGTQATEPDVRQRVLVMKPRHLTRPAPAVLLPFYYPERIAGIEFDTLGRYGQTPESNILGLALVRRGYVVYAPETFHLNLPKCELDRDAWPRWALAAAELKHRHPHWTGMGKLVADARLALDLMAADADVDPARLAVAGHSLGGKIAFFVGTLDPRLAGIVASDFGILWDSTNWQDEWYFGKKLAAMKASGMRLGQLLELAPAVRFFLIAGQYDHAGSRVELRDGDGFCNHATGHAPTPEALALAWQFLDQSLRKD